MASTSQMKRPVWASTLLWVVSIVILSVGIANSLYYSHLLQLNPYPSSTVSLSQARSMYYANISLSVIASIGFIVGICLMGVTLKTPASQWISYLRRSTANTACQEYVESSQKLINTLNERYGNDKEIQDFIYHITEDIDFARDLCTGQPRGEPEHEGYYEPYHEPVRVQRAAEQPIPVQVQRAAEQPRPQPEIQGRPRLAPLRTTPPPVLSTAPAAASQRQTPPTVQTTAPTAAAAQRTTQLPAPITAPAATPSASASRPVPIILPLPSSSRASPSEIPAQTTPGSFLPKTSTYLNKSYPRDITRKDEPVNIRGIPYRNVKNPDEEYYCVPR
jgi:hypothetical protein